MAMSLKSSKSKHLTEAQPTIVSNIDDNDNGVDSKIKPNMHDATKTIATKKLAFGPITDITDASCYGNVATAAAPATTTTIKTPTLQTTIEHESQCSTSTNMRSKSKELEHSNSAGVDNVNGGKNEDGACLAASNARQKNCRSTHKNLTTGRISRSGKVTQDQLDENSERAQLKRDSSNLVNKVHKLNNKTEAAANGHIENVDAEASVKIVDEPPINDGKQCGDGCEGVVNEVGHVLDDKICKACNRNEAITAIKENASDCLDEADKPLNRNNEIKTTKIESATKAAASTTSTASLPKRPSTLSTGGNGFPVSTQTSPSLVKSSTLTPRTPTTTPLHSGPRGVHAHHHHQHHHHHPNCIANNRKQHFNGDVPRTTAITTTTTITSTKLTPKTPPATPDSPATYLDDDLDSIYSFATTTSGRSTMSCEHSYVAHNGTTFSGRKNKFVIHNSQHAGLVGSAYVTPTQRAQAQIRKLKALLHAMQLDLNQKNDEILKLTREVAELRLFKASLNSPEERSASSDAVTVREAELQTSQDVSPIVDMVDETTKSSPRHCSSAAANSTSYHQNYLHQQQSVMQLSSEMQSSFADSGHFEDMTSMSVHSKDTHDGSDEDVGARGNDAAMNAVAAAEREVEVQRQELIRMYEQRIEELIRNQDVASTEMKRIHNDKVEALLQKLSECNTRYADIVPDFEMAKERIRELEGQLEDLQRKLFENEDKQNKMYLHMYQKGQEAERIARADQALELAHRAPTNHVSINELLHQLQSTQEELENIRTIYRRLLEAQKNRSHVDPEVTLQFLKSAVYYFLTDKENSQGHLQAIESILDFTEAEKQNIERARAAK